VSAAHEQGMTETQSETETETTTIDVNDIDRGTVFRDRDSTLWRAGIRGTAHRIDWYGTRLDGLPWKRQTLQDMFGPLTTDETTKRLSKAAK